jgi:hypothetical protein
MKTLATPFGLLHWEDFGWRSEPMRASVFSGRPIVIQLLRDEAAEPISAEEFAALERFFAMPAARALEIIPHLWAYYCEVRDNSDPKPALISGPGEIWKHVFPKNVDALLGDDGFVYLSLEGECDWEPEHGVQLVLQNGDRWVRVSDYSGHLTDGQAFGCPALDTWMSDRNASLPVRTRQEMAEVASRSKVARP